MRIFSCTHCGHAIFFENVQCLHCGNSLAFLPDPLIMAAIEPAIDDEHLLWHRTDDDSGRAWRLCQNSTLQHACNFAVPAEDPNLLCVSCRQTRMAPDLSVPANHEHWVSIESAKRRLYYTLAKLHLTADHAHDLVFEFLADIPGGPQVLTGHQNGVITLNIAEADDAERARRRIELHEPYRTLLGHLRHESGHFFWDRLILQQGRVAQFNEVFGDHQLDYRQALADYYSAGGAATTWHDDFVSGYATAHPWEDWAETWAHYLHMVDLLETASSYDTTLAVPGDSDGTITVADPFRTGEHPDFDDLVAQWMPVTLLVNSMNRSLGQGDAYPFALTPGALRKLRFVHDVISTSADAEGNPSAAVTQPAPAAEDLAAQPESKAATN